MHNVDIVTQCGNREDSTQKTCKLVYCPFYGMPWFWALKAESFVYNSVLGTFLQGVSHWNVSFELSLTDKNMQVRFCLNVVLECWD
jgi:hypothetical protein